MAGRYELTLVARVPASSGAPTLTEIGPIVAPQITWTRELNGPGSVQFSTTSDRLATEVRSQLLTADTTPCEVWLYRDGVLEMCGVIPAYQEQAGQLSVTAPGLLFYTAYMGVDADYAPAAATDQFTIAKTLVDQWQALAYGNYGISTGAIGTSGIVKTLPPYLAAERHQVSQRLLDLGKATDGFDIDVDPATRILTLSYPKQGSDLSASVVLDARNVTDASVSWSAAPGDLATDVLGVATSSGSGALTSKKTNATLRARWGRAWASQTFNGITAQAELDNATQAYVDARAAALVVPGPGLLPVDGAGVDDFHAGDTVTYDFDAGLGRRTGAYRVQSKQVTVAEDGSEMIAVKFV